MDVTVSWPLSVTPLQPSASCVGRVRILPRPTHQRTLGRPPSMSTIHHQTAHAGKLNSTVTAWRTPFICRCNCSCRDELHQAATERRRGQSLLSRNACPPASPKYPGDCCCKSGAGRAPSLKESRVVCLLQKTSASFASGQCMPAFRKKTCKSIGYPASRQRISCHARSCLVGSLQAIKESAVLRCFFLCQSPATLWRPLPSRLPRLW